MRKTPSGSPGIMKRSLALCGVWLLALIVLPAARADLIGLTVLEPGDVEIPLVDDTTDHNGTNPIGTVVASTGIETINNTNTTGTATLSGSFISEVYLEASGTLDFYYQLTISGSVNASVENMAVSSFLDSSISSLDGVAAGYVGDVALFGTSGVPAACGFGASPACGAVMLTGADTGSGANNIPSFGVAYDNDVPLTGTLNFDWGASPMGNGSTSVVFAISTNDTLFELGGVSLEGSDGTSQDLFGFEPLGPVSSVPEPVSVLLLGATLGVALFIRSRHAPKVSKAESKVRDGADFRTSGPISAEFTPAATSGFRVLC